MPEILKIDDKWSVEYDPENNDRPLGVKRYGEDSPAGILNWSNDVHAMFYALLEARAEINNLIGVNQRDPK